MLPKVLLVDDEPRVTQALCRSLRRGEYEVLTATSAEEALTILADEAMDVVVSDEQMPGMRGSEFLAEVSKQYPETIRMVLTGHATLEGAIRSINEGHIYRFLLKPCRGADLAAAIRQGLQHKRLLYQTSRLLRLVQRQSGLLQQLERTHPGITRIDRDADGTIVIEDTVGDVAELLGQLDCEVERVERQLEERSE